MKTLRARPRAFTLIELLTVIAIIGILAAILIPVVGRVRVAARTATATQNLRQIGQAMLMYVSDNRNQLPAGGGWRGGTLSYMIKGTSTNTEEARAMYEKVYLNPNQDPQPTGRVGPTTRTHFAANNAFNLSAGHPELNYARIARPNRTIFVADATVTEGNDWTAGNRLWAAWNGLSGNPPAGKSPSDPLDGDSGEGSGDQSKFAYRNAGKALRVHLDGSVASFGPGQTTYGHLNYR